ncbi:MAG: NUDIX hydrolase [Acholeplasmataceae bacterium]|nr:NUDIX hydrolase [Acholeplasmataceae bacterium]
MEKTKTHRNVYHCPFLDVYEDEAILQDGQIGKRVYIDHPGGAAALAITEDDQVILVNQYRYPIKQMSLEIPGGKKDFKGELGVACIQRELEEETGYKATILEPLILVHNCVGYSNEIIEIFVAKQCTKMENPKSADADEWIEVGLYDKKAIKKLMEDKKITDSKTIIALQAFLSNQF